MKVQALRAQINIAAAGDNVVSTPAAGVRVSVFGIVLVPAAAVTVAIKSGTTADANETPLTAVMSLAANVPFVLPVSEIPWFRTASGAKLNIELGGAVQVSGALVYSHATEG